MKKLFTGQYDSLINFIFNIYDFDKDGLISKEDIRIVLSYVPLEVDNKYTNFRQLNCSQFKDRVESQEELHILLEKVFKNSETLNLKKFIHAIENISSDILLFILIFLMKKKPFSANFIEEFALKHNGGEMPKSPTFSKKLIASPNLQSKFSSSKIILKSPSFTKGEFKKTDTNKNSSKLGFDLPGTQNFQESKNLLNKFAHNKSTTNNIEDTAFSLNYANKTGKIFLE
jgi:hypothetical protein